MDKPLFAFENLRNIQDLIKFIDQKAGALLVVYGFILTAFIDFAKRLKFVNVFELNGVIEIVLSILTFVVGIGLVFFITYQLYIIIVLILKPRIAGHYAPQELSVMYYEHICQMGKVRLLQEFNALNEQTLANEILGQVFEVSKILDKKSKYLAKTMNYLLYTIIGLLFFILLSQIV